MSTVGNSNESITPQQSGDTLFIIVLLSGLLLSFLLPLVILAALWTVITGSLTVGILISIALSVLTVVLSGGGIQGEGPAVRIYLNVFFVAVSSVVLLGVYAVKFFTG